MNKKAVLLTFLLLFCFISFAGVILYGTGEGTLLENRLKFLQSGLSLQSTTVNPMETNINGEAGDIAISTNGNAYIKRDSGVTTNWFKIEAGNTTGNLLTNPSFESHLIATSDGWTNTNGTVTNDTATKVVGNKAMKIALSAETLSIEQILTNANYANKEMITRCEIKSSSTVQVCSLADSVEVDCSDYDGSDNWILVNNRFIAPSTGLMGLRVKGISMTDDVFVDECYLGSAPELPEVSQARVAGVAYFDTTINCIWSRTSTALGAFSTDADCPAPTIEQSNIGIWDTTDTDLPKITINDAPAGTYYIYADTYLNSSSGTGVTCIAVNDGTDTRGRSCRAGSANQDAASIAAVFEYSSTSNRTFELYGSAHLAAIMLENGTFNKRTVFTVVYYPPKSKIFAGTAPVAFEGQWPTQTNCAPVIGNSVDGSWNNVADSDCSTFSPLVGAGFNHINDAGKSIGISGNMKAGKYEICMTFYDLMTGTSGTQTYRVAICSGSDVCAATGETYLPVVAMTMGTQTGSPVRTCGLYDNLSTKIVTINLQEKTQSAGNITVHNIHVDSQDRQISISVKPLDTLAALVLKERLTTPGINKSVLMVATVAADETVTHSGNAWITSCTNADPSICTFVTNFFKTGIALNCLANSNTNSHTATVQSSTDSQMTVDRTNSSTAFTVFCHGVI